MALIVLRSSFARSGAIKSLLGSSVHPAATTSPIQVATLKATFGETYPYEKPYPYETKSFNVITEFFDKTMPRICENSKIITVDGNLGVGKNEFAKRIAKEFDLKYIPSVPDSECFRLRHNNYDIRGLNELLPENLHFYDWENFLKEKDLTNGFVGRLQLQWYREKFEVYSNALRHLFHTGQGVVITRSVFSDHVLAEAMRKCGYVTKNFMDYYYMYRDNSICELLQPHLSIYLDVPLDIVRERLIARGNESELQSPAISDKFLQSIDDIYKNKFIPRMRSTGEVLEVDWADVADDLDMDAIATEMAMLTYDSQDVEDPKFQDWYKVSEDRMSWYRRRFGSNEFMMKYFARAYPTECPEICYDVEDYPIQNKIVNLHPAVMYNAGAAPEFGHSRLKMW